MSIHTLRQTAGTVLVSGDYSLPMPPRLLS